MLYTINFKMVLIAYECEIAPKGHNEPFDILNNLLFHHSLINVLTVTFPNFFHIDKIKCVLILEHHYSLASLLCIKHRFWKVVGKLLLAGKGVVVNELYKDFYRQVFLRTPPNIIVSFLQFFYLAYNSWMVRKRHSQELHRRKVSCIGNSHCMVYVYLPRFGNRNYRLRRFF